MKAPDADDPAVVTAREILEEYGDGLSPSQQTLLGIANGMIMESILERAGDDPTRESLMAAHDSTSLPDGPWYGTIEMSPDDHAALECLQILENQAGRLTPVDEQADLPLSAAAIGPGAGRLVSRGCRVHGGGAAGLPGRSAE